MSTTANPVTAAATKESFAQKLEAWFMKLRGEIETDLTEVFGSSVAKDIESAASSILTTALGQAALQAVTSATDLQTGKINVSQAATAIGASAKSAGKTIASSTMDLLISVARQTVESKFGIKTTTAQG
jgi:PAB1-binding protein PBP1